MDLIKTFNYLKDLYGIKGEISSYRQITNGHINDTYCVVIGKNEYIFQKINNYVFKDPVVVMRNIRTVDNYIKNNNIETACKIVTFLENKKYINYTVTENNEYWRISKYEANTVTFDVIENANILRSSGYAFGDFLNAIADLPIDSLYITIPDFHNTRKRLDAFFQFIEKLPDERLMNVNDEIEVFKKHRDFCCKLTDMADNLELPLRPVHNDTKYNNILLDKDTYKPVCVIDLDTIMPGLVVHDYGDAIRFACNSAAEDETDLSKISLDMDYFKEFTHGFMEAACRFLTPNEVNSLVYGAPTIAFELASRFLADHIDGDKYFTIHRQNHNLDRARCQMTLALDMMKKLDEMNDFITSCAKANANNGK